MYEHELKQRIPDAELILTLEPEELAGVLLPILHKEGSNYQGKISGYNFCNGFRQMKEIYPRQAVPTVTRVIMETWNWMLNQGLAQLQMTTLALGVFDACRGETPIPSRLRAVRQSNSSLAKAFTPADHRVGMAYLHSWEA